MRLAEFKSWLFIFFAGRLLKWVESVAPEVKYGQSPPATPVDDSNAVLFAEPSGESEAASGPPEHWARILASGPPKHWLDLVREKAPHLLSLTENDLVSPQAGALEPEGVPTETEQEASGPPASDESAGEKSQPPLLHKRRTGHETKYSEAKPSGSSWLKRLRFQPPVRRTQGLEPSYIADARTVNSDTSSAAGGAAEEGSESGLRQPGLKAGEIRYLPQDPGVNETGAAGKTIARFPGNPENERLGSDRERHYPTAFEQAALRPIHAGPPSHECFSNPSEKQTRPEQTRPAALQDASHNTRSNIRLERNDTYAISKRARSNNESIDEHYIESSPKPATRFKELDRGDSMNLEERARPGSSTTAFHQKVVEEATVDLDRAQSWIEKQTTRTRQSHDRFRQGREGIAKDSRSNAPGTLNIPNSRVRNKSLSSSQRVIKIVATNEQATTKFASVKLGAATSHESWIEPRENLWPTLPPMPKFDTADELAAMDQEAEGLRRLDLEQRGTLWNA